MKCAYHVDIEAVGQCGECNRPLCSDCAVDINGATYCRSCLQKKVAPQSSNSKTGCRRSPFWTFVFSMVPGGGYMYLGLMNRGLQTMLIFFGSVFLSNLIGIESLMALVAPVVIFYSIFDAQQLVRAINKGEAAQDRQFIDISAFQLNPSWIGYGLVIIGALALFTNINSIFPWINTWAIRRVGGPLLIMGLGVFILFRNTKSDPGGGQDE